MPSYYTPYLTQAGAAIGSGINQQAQRRREAELNKVAGNAYMGDPQAMQNLMQLNPQLGAQIQSNLIKRQEAEKQKQLTQMSSLKKDYDKITENLAAFPDFESSKAYGNEQLNYLKQQYPDVADKIGEYDEEDYQHAKTIGGNKGEFGGTSMDAQVSNILTKGVEDPEFRNSPEYARAWQLANEPKIVRTPTGDHMMRPELPAMFKPPGNEARSASGLPGSPKIIPGTEKISKDQKDYNKDYSLLKKSYDSMQNYIEVLGELGPQMSVGPLNAKDTQKLESAYARAMLDAKETNNLGVLNGPDVGIIEKLMGNPTGISGQIRGKEALQSGATEAMKQITDNFKSLNDIMSDSPVKTKELNSGIKKQTELSDDEYQKRKKALGL